MIEFYSATEDIQKTNSNHKIAGVSDTILVSDKTGKEYHQGKAKNITMDTEGHFIIKKQVMKIRLFKKFAIVYFKDFTTTSTWDKYLGIN